MLLLVHIEGVLIMAMDIQLRGQGAAGSVKQVQETWACLFPLDTFLSSAAAAIVISSLCPIPIKPVLQLAMLAMLAAFGAEVATGKTIFAQIQEAPLLIAATFVTIIVGSVCSPSSTSACSHALPFTTLYLSGKIHFVCPKFWQAGRAFGLLHGCLPSFQISVVRSAFH
jgi:hypothetical protein